MPSAGAATNGPFTVSATFSETVTGFVIGDITPTNAALTAFSGSGTTYTFLKTGVYTKENSKGKTQGKWKCDTQGFVELDGKQKLSGEKKPFQN